MSLPVDICASPILCLIRLLVALLLSLVSNTLHAQDFTAELKTAYYQGIPFAAPDEPKFCATLKVSECIVYPGILTSCHSFESNATVKTLTGGNWLGLVVDRPWLPGQFCVYLRPEVMHLAPGSYSGTVTLKSRSSNNEGRVNVSLNVCPLPQSFTPRTPEITFNHRLGSKGPSSQSVLLLSLDAACPTARLPNIVTSVSTESGGDWLTAKPPGSAIVPPGMGVQMSAQANVQIPPDGLWLEQGAYGGAITASCTNCVSAELANFAIPVHLNILPAGPPVVTSVLNGASLSSGKFDSGAHKVIGGAASGSWITIIGESLLTRPATTWQQSDFDSQRLPTSLHEVHVTVGGVDAAISYVSWNQINALLPPDVPTGSVALTVKRAEQTRQVRLEINKYAPELFSFPPQNIGVSTPRWIRSAIAVTAEGELVATGSIIPKGTRMVWAKAGDRIIIYGTGFGPTDPPAPSNQLFPQALPLPSLDSLVIRIGTRPASLPSLPPIRIGEAAKVEWAGLVSPGLYQFNIVVPEVPFGGHHLVTVEMDGAHSIGEAYLYVIPR